MAPSLQGRAGGEVNMKKIYFFGFVCMLALTACSDYDYDHSNLSDKNITFKVADVSASVETEASINGRAATGGHVVVNKAIQAAPNDYKPMYLQRYVGQTPSRTHLEGISKDSRAATTTANLTSFGLLAYRYESGNSATTPNFMYNEQVSKSGNVWSSTQQYNWPANTDKIDFYAYAPFVENGTGSGIILSSSSASGVPVIDFTMQQAAANQIDLVAAVATGKDKTNSASGVSLTFIHALTTVKFVKGDDLLGTIKSITIKNVYLSGKYTIGGTWSFTGKTATNYAPAMNTSLMMIPQQFGSNALVEVVYNDGLNDYTLNYPLSTETWTAGETITYRISSEEMSSLHLGYVNFPVLKDNFPKTAYANGDEMGLYVVDDEGNIKNNNVKLTYNGTSWSAASSVIFSPQYNYYAYFPYKESGLGHSINSAKPMSRATGYTADTLSVSGFFSSGIGTWNISDQSTAEKFMAADLQIAKGFVSVGDALTLRFDMSHALGLAQFELGTNNSGKEFYLSIDNTYRWTGTAVSATSSFSSDSNKPYPYETYNYYMWVQPNTDTTIKSVTNDPDSWTSSLTFNVAANTLSEKQTVHGARNESGLSSSYTLQVGDILYSDGSLSHQTERVIPGKTPVAIVFMATTNASNPVTTTKDRTANSKWKHGYAMALKYVRSNNQKYTCTWGPKNEDVEGVNNVDAGSAQTRFSDMEGYTNSIHLNSSTYPAGYAAKTSFSSQVTAPTNSSGWFLPASRQWYYFFVNLAGMPTEFTNQYYGWDSGTFSVSTASVLNDKMKIVGSDYFDAFTQSNASDTFFWTSTETSGKSAALLISFTTNNGVAIYNNTKEYLTGVRSALAF